MKMKIAWSFAAFGCLASGCLLDDDVEGMDNSIYRRQATTVDFLPVSKVDRFGNGGEALQGIGSKPEKFQDDAKLAVLSVTEIGSALDGLRKSYPNRLGVETAAEKTHEGRDIYYAVVGSKQPRVFLTSGVHARERGGPDNILYLISDLLWADKQNTGLTYDSKTYTVSQVRQVLDAGVAFIPAVNPDGINYDQTTNSCWRKNRRPIGSNTGVDINRNFNIFWEKRLFSPNARLSQTDRPQQDNYIGPAPLSEVETRSVTRVFASVPSLTWYLDLHSALGQVLYGWGDDFVQVNDPTMSFLNKTFDGQRGVLDDQYKEYMEADDFNAQKSISERMASAMNSVAKQNRYSAAETITLYPAMGSSDEAMARYYNHTCDANRINGLTFEFGLPQNSARKPATSGFLAKCQSVFYPNAVEYRNNVLHTSVGLMEFLLNAAGKAGEPKIHKCQNDQKNPQQASPKPQNPKPAQNDPLATSRQSTCSITGKKEFDACSGNAGCRANAFQKTRKCRSRADFASKHAEEVQAWMKKDIDMIRQASGLQYAMQKDASLQFQLGTRLDKAEKELAQKFGDYDFEEQVQKHFDDFVALPNVGFAMKNDATLRFQLPRALADSKKDMLKMDRIQ